MEIRISPPKIPLLLIQVSLKPLKKINANKKTVEKVVQLLESTLPTLQKRTKIKIKPKT